MTTLRLLRNEPVLCQRPTHECEEQSVELACSLAERVVAVANMRPLARAALRALSSGHDAAAALWLSEISKLLEREAVRAESAARHQAEAIEQAPALTLVQAVAA